MDGFRDKRISSKLHGSAFFSGGLAMENSFGALIGEAPHTDTSFFASLAIVGGVAVTSLFEDMMYYRT